MEKMYSGCYRIRASGSHLFGQVRRCGRAWHAEIRECASGALIQFAGIWTTRREAAHEVRSILDAGWVK